MIVVSRARRLSETQKGAGVAVHVCGWERQEAGCGTLQVAVVALTPSSVVVSWVVPLFLLCPLRSSTFPKYQPNIHLLLPFSTQLYFFSPYFFFSNFPVFFTALILHLSAVVNVRHVRQQPCFAPCQPSHWRRPLGVEQCSADRCPYRHLFPAPRCSHDCSARRLFQRLHVYLLQPQPGADAAAGPNVPDADAAG